MLPLIFGMKIFEYTFKLPKLSIENGKLMENGYTEETYTFTLLHRGFGLYEDLTGKPLMAKLMELENVDESLEKIISKEFISNLACASYVKIDGDKFHNNRATAEEFRKSAVYSKTTEDVNFIKGLIQMALECITDVNNVSKKQVKKEEKKQ